MHAHRARRLLGPRWRWVERAALAALAVQLSWLICSPAHADTRVEYLHVEAVPGFAAQRQYAGSTVAHRSADLGFKQRGEVAQLSADIGDRVAAGQSLGHLVLAAATAEQQRAAADLAFAEANLRAQQAQTELAAQTEMRFRDLRARGHASAQVYDEARLGLRTAEAQLRVSEASRVRAVAALSAAEVTVAESHLRAPFAGVIQARYVDEGSQVGPDRPVLRLVAAAPIEAHIGIPPSLADSLRDSGPHRVQWNNTAYDAELVAIAPEIDTTTRTLNAVFRLAEADIPLGVVVELNVASQVASAGYWVPVSALTESDRGLWGVYVVNAASVVERHLVEVVHSEADRVFVRGTLAPDDRVIRTGVQRVVPGQRVTLAASGG